MEGDASVSLLQKLTEIAEELSQDGLQEVVEFAEQIREREYREIREINYRFIGEGKK